MKIGTLLYSLRAMNNLYAYLQAILSRWIFLLSGIGSVFLLLLALTRFRERTPRWIIVVVSLICFQVASYNVWIAEHEAKQKLQQDLELLSVPRLVGSFGAMSAVPAVRQNKDTVFTGDFDIKNLGAPSLADKFSLTLITPKSKIVGILQHQPFKYRVRVVGDEDSGYGEVIIPDSYYLPLYKNGAIPTNAQISGFLEVLFVDITPEAFFRPENKLRLEFVDANNKIYSYEHDAVRRDEHR